LNSLTQDDLQHCFQQWKIRMERCRDRGGDYIEGDNISIVWFVFNKGLEHESGFFIATPRMLSWLKLLIKLFLLYLGVVYVIVSMMHGHTNIKYLQLTVETVTTKTYIYYSY